MVGKLLLIISAVIAVLLVMIVGFYYLTSGGGYSAGPLADGSSYPLLCKKKQTAVPTTGKYTTASDNKTYNVEANLSAALRKVDGNGTYVVDSKELLGVAIAQPGSLKFTYTC